MATHKQAACFHILSPPRTLFRPWNSPSPRHKFLRKSWSRFSFSARIRGFPLHPPAMLMVRFRLLRRSMCFCMLFFVYKEVLGGAGWVSGRAPSERLEHSPGIRIASVGRWAWWVVPPGIFLKHRNLEIFQLLSVTGAKSFAEVGILATFKCLLGGGVGRILDEQDVSVAMLTRCLGWV